MARVEAPPVPDTSPRPEELRLHKRHEVVVMLLIAAVTGLPYVLAGVVTVFTGVLDALQSTISTTGGIPWSTRASAFFPAGVLAGSGLSIVMGVAVAYALTGRDGRWFCLGRLYLYEDRLMWRFFRFTRCVYFSGAEEVRCGTKWLTLSREGARIRIPYTACAHPSYERFHALLCRRSEVYRNALETPLPWRVSRLRRRAFSCLVVAAVALVLDFAVTPGWGLLTLLAAFMVAAAVRMAVPCDWRFDTDAIYMTRAGRTRRYDIRRLKDAYCIRGHLHLVFENNRRLTLPQHSIPYPLPVLRRHLKRWYPRQFNY